MNRTILLTVWLALQVGQFAFSCGVKEDYSAIARHEFGKARRLIKQLEYDEAQQHLDRAVALDPDNLEYLAARGWYYIRVGLPEVARRDFWRVLQLHPDLAEAHADYARSLPSLPRYMEDELHHYTRAIELGGEDLAAWYYSRAHVRERMNQYYLALADYEQALQIISSDSAWSHPWRALIYLDAARLRYDIGDIDGAVEIIEQGDSDPNVEIERPSRADRTTRQQLGPFVVTQEFSGSGSWIEHAHSSDPVQIGRPVPRFSVRDSKNRVLSNEDLLGEVYVILRWSPEAYVWDEGGTPYTASSRQIRVEDDFGMLDILYDELQERNLPVRIFSLPTKPMDTEPFKFANAFLESHRSSIGRKKRPWSLVVPADSDSDWLLEPAVGAAYRLLVVDAEGVIQLGLLSTDAVEIKDVVLSTLQRILPQIPPGLL